MLYQRLFDVKYTANVDILLLKLKVIWPVSHCSVIGVMGMETKLACIKQTYFFNVPFDCFQNNFLE
jgi:hypothetical protein